MKAKRKGLAMLTHRDPGHKRNREIALIRVSVSYAPVKKGDEMKRFTTGWFRPKTEKPMCFMSVVYCADCRQVSTVPRLGTPCPKCGSGPENVTRATGWDFDNPRVRGLHLGKVVAR